MTMAKTITVSTVTEETLTSKAGKPYTAVTVTGTELATGLEYKRTLFKNLLTDVGTISEGDTITLFFVKNGQFFNVDRVVKGTASDAPARSPKASSGTTGKKFSLTEESVRIGALQVAVAEAPGKPVNMERVNELIGYIKTGELAGAKAETFNDTSEELDNPF